MRSMIVLAAAASLLAFQPLSAEENGAPAAPSGAPAAAAQEGSSEAGKPASKNEMSTHNANAAKQGMQATPHKQSE